MEEAEMPRREEVFWVLAKVKKKHETRSDSD
jgi:hypothetical protein